MKSGLVRLGEKLWEMCARWVKMGERGVELRSLTNTLNLELDKTLRLCLRG
jgi:hypothetical protein